MSVRDGITNDEAFAAPHVLLPHGGELDLTGRVQNVEQAGLRVDHSSLLVSVLDRRVMVVDEVVLDILQGQGTLADASVAEDDYAVAPDASRGRHGARTNAEQLAGSEIQTENPP